MLSKKFDSPPGYVDAKASHEEMPAREPLIAPTIMPAAVIRVHMRDRLIGMTAEPMSTPMKR